MAQWFFLVNCSQEICYRLNFGGREDCYKDDDYCITEEEILREILILFQLRKEVGIKSEGAVFL
jgi:hypothetical protein